MENTAYSDTVVVREKNVIGALGRISWGAVIGGVVLALVVQILLGMLGLGIGLSTVDPATGDTPSAQAFGIGAGVWWIVSSLLALFIGGWVAAHLAGNPQRTDGMLHGLLTWAVTTLVTLYLIATGLGTLIGGTASMLGSVASSATQAAASVAPEIVGRVRGELEERDIGLEDVRREALQILRQTRAPELQPENVRDRAQETIGQLQTSASQAARAPATADEEAGTLIERVLRQARETVDAADRDALVNVVMARTGQSREQAQQTVQNWIDEYQAARTRVEQAAERTAAQARETADRAAEAMSRAALWTFVGLLLAAIAAGLGGALGRPREVVTLRP